jgi:spore coat polysaccharide biosynthesis protein SpsF
VHNYSIITVVPCRMLSMRLPGKAMQPIFGVPSIERCLLNTLAIVRSRRTVLATSTNRQDDILSRQDLDGRVSLVRGPEDDVLERFLTAIEQFGPEHALRITGDSPAVSYELANLLIESHLETGADVTYPKWGTYPAGIGAEVYSVRALRKLRRLFPSTPQSEYLIMYFRNNPGHFQINEVIPSDIYRHPEWRLTLDVPADMELFNLIYQTLDIGRKLITFEQIVQFFADHPEAIKINANVPHKHVGGGDFIMDLNRETTIKSSCGDVP